MDGFNVGVEVAALCEILVAEIAVIRLSCCNTYVRALQLTVGVRTSGKAEISPSRKFVNQSINESRPSLLGTNEVG